MNDERRESLIKAMSIAGYHYDPVESSDDNIRFQHEFGTLMFENWQDAGQWIEHVAFNDPITSETVEMFLHQERFDRLQILKTLCRKNGREYSFTKDGCIVTFDKYDGCDGRISENIEQAIEWEKGYIFPVKTFSDQNDDLSIESAYDNESKGLHL